MGSFKLGGMTFGSLFKKPETVQYPAQHKEAPVGLKGHITLDESTCILCGICQKTCPCGTIEVNKAERTWSINRFQCIQCGSCVRACPKASLTMEPTYTSVATSIHTDTFTVPEKAQ